jgi:hypothetical protein
MPGQVNQDGTVQVSPPKISAFSQQASAGAPPPPSPQAQAAMQHPGFGEAIMQMISQLMSALNPNTARAPRATENAINQADPGPNAALGQQFGKQ